MADQDLIAIPVDELDVRYAELRIAQPRLEGAMSSSMERFGQISPVVATLVDGELVLVDGFKRLAAARALGLQTLAVRVLPLTSRAAVAAVYGLNQGGKGLMDLEEALVVRKLVRELGLSQVEVAELLAHHKSWVSRRLALVERLCDDVQADVRVGLITPTVAREVAKLPRGNQPEVAATVHQHGLSTREATALVALFERCTDRRQQRGLLDDPRSALHALGKTRSAPHDPRLGARANELRRQALRLIERAARLSRQLTEAGAADWSDTEREVLIEVLRRARDAVGHLPDELGTVVEALQSADGP